MTSLRERLKRKRRETVLEAAQRLFREKGYAQTSIADIADAAQISVGTLYAYFGSKGGIMHELVQPLIEDMRERGRKVVENPPSDPADAFSALFTAHRFNEDWISLNLLKAFERRVDADQPIARVEDEFRSFIVAQLRELAQSLVRAGSLNPDINIEDLAFILYTLLLRHFDLYLEAEGRTTYEELTELIDRRVRMLFLPWSLSTPGPDFDRRKD